MAELGEVFISYSWDSEQHIQSVLRLSNRLRSDGIDCVLDQYEVSPPEGWPRWMDRKIAEASSVLVICTETYLDRVMGREAQHKGPGVKWEGSLIYQHLYNAGDKNTKFVPVILCESDRPFIPMPLQGATHFFVDGDKGYERLYARLLGRPVAQKPPLGERRSVPYKEVKTSFAAYVMAPINVPLWDKAKWVATAFGSRPGSPPLLGIAFVHRAPAEKIFQQWHDRYGTRDEFEELRVSIIEGTIPGEQSGYTVHIGADFENTIRRYRQSGLEIDDESILALVSRLNRMTPEPQSPYLAMFKNLYREHGEYLLIPATCRPDGTNLEMALSSVS
jgi:TIR domain